MPYNSYLKYAILAGTITIFYLVKKTYNRNPYRQTKAVVEAKNPRLSKVIMTEVLLPSQADSFNVALSGVLMSWIDICAGIAAKSHSELPCVTASVDAVQFIRPVYVGEAVIITSAVTKSWNTSIEVAVTVEAENFSRGNNRLCCHAYLTFVALKEGKPAQVPAVLPETEEEKALCKSAESRRQARLEAKKNLKTNGKPPEEEKIGTEEEESLRPQPFIQNASFQFQIPDIIKNILASVPKSHIPTYRSYTQTVEILMPQHANSLQVTFGGHVIRRMEECAIIAAFRHCGSSSIIFRSVSIDSLSFRCPTVVGDVLIVRGYVSRVWNTSLEVYLTVHSFSLNNNAWDSKEVNLNSRSNSYKFTNDGFITFVAVKRPSKLTEETDDMFSQSPMTAIEPVDLTIIEHKLPPVYPINDTERWRFSEASKRKEARLKGRDWELKGVNQ